MAADTPIAIDLPPELADADREALLAAFRSEGTVQDTTQRPFDPVLAATIWHTFVAVMKDAGVVAGGATAVMTLAEKINSWRKELRAQGKTPQGRLRRPDWPQLDLATASDDEVLAWLLQTPPKP